MNYRFVFNQLGLLLIVLAVILLGVAGYESLDYLLADRTNEAMALTAMLAAGGIGLIVGGALWLSGKGQGGARFGRHEALLLVAASWLIGAALCGMPYFIWAYTGGAPSDHPFRHFVDCYFEAMSGLTTTGATVLSDIESLPRGILLWRALTHWLGGLGIVVLFVAVLPTLGVGGKKLFIIEAPGPTPTGVKPRIKDTARVLWYIYLGLTIIQTVLLRLAGMSWFDATCHTMATLATGGFSTKNASLGFWESSPAIIWIVIFFMVLAGANFGLYYQVIRGELKNVFKDSEFRVYLAVIAVTSIVVVGSIYVTGKPLPLTNTAQGEAPAATMSESIEQGVFTAVSVQTTTGFCTGDFDTWPFLAKATLVTLMFIGGCAGSTAGGIKVIRLWVAFKILFTEVERVFNPNVVRPLRLSGGASITNEVKLGVMVYCFGCIVLFALGALVVMLLELGNCTFTTAATSSAATLFTIGPGLEAVGATQNYGWMTGPTKAFLSLMMALGRLEVFAIFVLFVPAFWRGK